MYIAVEIFNMSVCVCRIKEWVDQLQQELVSLADTASAGNNLKQVRGPIHTHTPTPTPLYRLMYVYFDVYLPKQIVSES